MFLKEQTFHTISKLSVWFLWNYDFLLIYEKKSLFLFQKYKSVFPKCNWKLQIDTFYTVPLDISAALKFDLGYFYAFDWYINSSMPYPQMVDGITPPLDIYFFKPCSEIISNVRWQRRRLKKFAVSLSKGKTHTGNKKKTLSPPLCQIPSK